MKDPAVTGQELMRQALALMGVTLPAYGEELLLANPGDFSFGVGHSFEWNAFMVEVCVGRRERGPDGTPWQFQFLWLPSWKKPKVNIRGRGLVDYDKRSMR